jgi:hypothetical protein
MKMLLKDEFTELQLKEMYEDALRYTFLRDKEMWAQNCLSDGVYSGLWQLNEEDFDNFVDNMRQMASDYFRSQRI